MPLLALEGIRAIEIATDVAGPFCGKLLADYGAEVIKIETPGVGDTSRCVGPFPNDSPHPEKSALFLHLNTNKSGVTLDLTSETGRDLFRGLVGQSQVVIESGKPGRLESLDLGYQSLQRLRPEVVMTSVTPFGQTGPSKDYEYTELTIFAAGGAMHREGHPSREPLKYGAEVAQYFAGTSAAAATMAACFSAALTGDGRWIDVSIQECMAGHPHQIGRRAPFAYAGELDVRREPHTPFFGGRESYAVGTFRCQDGYASFLPLGPRMWPNFARMIGRPELVDDRRFASAQDRVEGCDELTAIFQLWLDGHSRAEVFEAAQEAGLPAGPVLSTGEVMTDPHFSSRGFFVDIDHPDAGSLTYTGLPFAISGAPSTSARPAPTLGQHTDAVLGGVLGVGADERNRLRRGGVI